MGKVVNPEQLGIRLCQALKISPKGVIGIRLEVYLGAVATVTIQRIVTVSEDDITEHVFEKYKLMREDDSADEASSSM